MTVRYWLGRSLSKEHKNKISLSRKGKTWEEIYGKEGAEQLRKKRSQRRGLHKRTQETRDRMSNARKDNPRVHKFPKGHPDYTKKHCSGERHHNWKGGVWKFGKKFSIWYRTHTKEWKAIIKEVYKRDNYTCQRCFKLGGKLNAHHIIPYWITEDNDLKNLVTLCPKCHIIIEKEGFK